MSKIMKNGRVYGGTQSGGTSYVAGDGIEIASGDVLNVLVDDESLHFDPTYNYAYVDGKYRTIFVGTQSAWDALTSEVKATYELVCINDTPDWTGNIDATPTEDSPNAVSSGGVYSAIQDYQKKDLASAVEGASTVEGALGVLSTNKATQAEVNDIVNVLGAKNLLPFNLSHIKKVNGGGTWNGNVYTYRDITYTVNADGTITVNGTANGDSIFRVLDNASLDFALNSNKTYYYTGSPTSGSSASTYYSYYSELVGGTWTYFMNYGASDTSVTPNASATQIVVDIFVKSGETIDNQIFKPMLRLASDPDDTYQPYAMTNKQITDVIPSDTDVSNKLVTESDLNDVFRVYEYTSSNTPTKASFLTLLASSNAHMDFKFVNVVTDYMPNSSSYWYVQKFGGVDTLHIRLLATDWVSGDLYTGDANSVNNTITWWRLAGTQV